MRGEISEVSEATTEEEEKEGKHTGEEALGHSLWLELSQSVNQSISQAWLEDEEQGQDKSPETGLDAVEHSLQQATEADFHIQAHVSDNSLIKWHAGVEVGQWNDAAEEKEHKENEEKNEEKNEEQNEEHNEEKNENEEEAEDLESEHDTSRMQQEQASGMFEACLEQMKELQTRRKETQVLDQDPPGDKDSQYGTDASQADKENSSHQNLPKQEPNQGRPKRHRRRHLQLKQVHVFQLKKRKQVQAEKNKDESVHVPLPFSQLVSKFEGPQKAPPADGNVSGLIAQWEQ